MRKIRAKTQDVAFSYRMGAGFPGDVNRTHPANITPEKIDANAPPLYYGQPVLIDPTTQGVRPFTTGDTAQNAWGVTVRPYPLQQQSGGPSAALGAATPPSSGVMDVLRSGFIMVNLPFGGSPVKGGAVYVRVAATSGNHIIGTFEAASDGGNNVAVQNAVFNGSPDANGNVEIAFNI